MTTISSSPSLVSLSRPDGRQCQGSPSRPSAGLALRAEAGTLSARLSSGGSTRALATRVARRNTRLVVSAAVGTETSTREGILAPFVQLAKKVLGEKELKQIRAKIIKQHSGVMNDFVDTADSQFGEYVLRVLFNLADTNKNGVIEEQELAAALASLGFSKFLDDAQIKKMFSKADLDSNGELDFEEWKKTVPSNLKKNLVKLAKENGHDLGFMV